MPPAEQSATEGEGSALCGGCALILAFFFVVIAIAWPLLAMASGMFTPLALLLPILLGSPAFIIGTALAAFAIQSKSVASRGYGRRALQMIGAAVAVVVLFALIGFIVGAL
jgi:hypothetical protein